VCALVRLCGVDLRAGARAQRCFVASQLVEWMVANGVAATREAAVNHGKKMQAYGFLNHVCDDHQFADNFLFFRFYVDGLEADPGYTEFRRMEEGRWIFCGPVPLCLCACLCVWLSVCVRDVSARACIRFALARPAIHPWPPWTCSCVRSRALSSCAVVGPCPTQAFAGGGATP
jgi:hypothetical protein